MKNIKRSLCVVLLVFLLVGCLFGCSDNKNTLDVPVAPEVVELYQNNFISDLTKYCHSGAHFVLKEDIVLTEDWTPIGRTVGTAFNGVFDGDGHTISGLQTTGWKSDGTPVTILKRIMGWKADGTPVYKSSEIVKMTTRQTNGLTEVTDIIYEGDSDDPDLEEMQESGVEEEKTSFGSIGLFGYTYGATVKNLIVDNADFRFYGDGESVYAGIISGYDIASDFNNITVKNSSLTASGIYKDVVKYYASNARPSDVVPEADTKQYLGGIVGYSRGNRTVSETDTAYKPTVFSNINVENISLKNKAFVARFDAMLEAKYADQTLLHPEESSILSTELTAEDGYGSYTVYGYEKPIYQVFAGGVSGYSVGAEIDTVSVKDLNGKSGDVLYADKINVGGISSYLLGKESSVKKAVVNGVDFYCEGGEKPLVMAGGAFGEVKTATVSDNCTISNVNIEAHVGEKAQNVCAGGFSAYCDENAFVTGVSIDTVTLTSDFVSSGNIGSILSGFVGVLRDSTIGSATVQNATFSINRAGTDKYCFTAIAMGQVYGNSTVTGTIDTSSCYYYNDEKTEFTKTIAIFNKNNYVNEDGESSIRLYYAKNGKKSDVYVTVYGDLVAKMNGTSFRMRETTVWEALSEEEKALLNTGDKLFNVLGKTYYIRFYDHVGDKYRWNVIQDISTVLDSNKYYDPAQTYGFAKQMYLIELPDSAVGTDMASETFYTYDISTGELKYAAGKFQANTDYYVAMDTEKEKYELDITVYTESDKTIVVQKGRTEDDDVLAKATYSVSLDKFVTDTTVEDEVGNVYPVCPAEVYLDVFFAEGTGFLSDINRFVITDATGATNRNFGSYVFVSGRPNIPDDAVRYQSAE